ncbi:hypothetical protein [uncultured Sphingomonas sp.]|uniref:hypothetical protein n=1 Tax=uncultured Sphingomonas sp. TaxID=158754 RepID=UPI0025D374CA|nr:hypothetical protein [uncultured Sphingomonas sp.]
MPRAIAALAPTQGKSAAAMWSRNKAADSGSLGSCAGNRVLLWFDIARLNVRRTAAVPRKLFFANILPVNAPLN